MSDKMSATEKKELWAGAAAFIVAAALLGGVGARKNVGGQPAGTYLLSARFNTVDGLIPGATVRLAGMDVGKVVSMELEKNFAVVVTLGINDNVRLPDDSSAAIQSNSLVGTKYIELAPGGSDDMLTENGEIVYTEDAVNVLNLADKALAMAKSKKKY